MRQNKTLNGPIEVPEWIVLAAFRYALGRQSYVVSDVADLLHSLWPRLSDGSRKIIRRELEEYIAGAEKYNLIAFTPEDLTPWKNLSAHLTPLVRLSPAPQVVNPGVKLAVR